MDAVITGYHSIIYSDDPEATRAFLRDVLGWPHIDAGGGWLIFKTPPSEVGVHPTRGPEGQTWATVPHAQVSLMCDDIEATLAELRAEGVEVGDDVRDEGFGLVGSLTVPGAGELMIYQPRHELAHALPDGE
jgi:catechol 2,3-dioxygenase-like lactoylglutathione lyase family enzyme